MGQHSHLYNTTRWRERRATQLRKQPLCEPCLRRGTVTAANTADHVVPHRGDAELFWKGELQSMCQSCHSAGKQREERLGYSTEVGADGFPNDPRHPFNAAAKG